MMKRLLSGLLVLVSCATFGQVYKQDPFNDEYKVLSKRADSLYEVKQYRKAAETYTTAFAANGNSARIDDRFNAACSWAAIGRKDSAFAQLQMLVKGRFKRYNRLMIAQELRALHEDERWEAIRAGVKSNRQVFERGVDTGLVARLDTIMLDDQQYRMFLDPTEKRNGKDSKEMKLLEMAIRERDSINVLKVVAIIEQYGWPGPDTAGQEGSEAAFLVMQHAAAGIQEKYLPLVRDAARRHQMPGSALALMEDRVALAQGKPQLYGTQVARDEQGNYHVDRLKDPEHVDARRKELGMEPMADYVRKWQIAWDVKEYKRGSGE